MATVLVYLMCHIPSQRTPHASSGQCELVAAARLRAGRRCKAQPARRREGKGPHGDGLLTTQHIQTSTGHPRLEIQLQQPASLSLHEHHHHRHHSISSSFACAPQRRTNPPPQQHQAIVFFARTRAASLRRRSRILRQTHISSASP